ncbi:30S ribosomal protein S6 [Nitratifractor salsuginis]|uniref:Small ribosomal subunit protein bS6 n=1 Tax=Nitratifractor salsuginis (strain DSM 16511 / JCM 12458 / E9I37-1) TaxID=749222 RepID=E6X250_NITSE|nr:30S ribosomal protein S6 [Nitratifractor salsuginis]ADV47119.1 SSU ribosomal protein S6P [Nitratifractor salsuginis DSM 16511]
MNCYETLFVVKPTLTAEEIEGQIARVKEIIAENGGELKATDEMGMRRLAYPIEKQERGYYTVVYYTAPSEMVIELERQLRYNEEILRFMTVKYTNKKELAVFEKMVEAANKKPAPEKSEAPVAEEAPAVEAPAEEKPAETEAPAQEAAAESTEA